MQQDELRKEDKNEVNFVKNLWRKLEEKSTKNIQVDFERPVVKIFLQK